MLLATDSLASCTNIIVLPAPVSARPSSGWGDTKVAATDAKHSIGAPATIIDAGVAVVATAAATTVATAGVAVADARAALCCCGCCSAA